MPATELVTFAARYGVSNADAYVLPALFESVSNKLDMPIRVLLTEATYRNRALGEYLAAAAHRVAVADRKESALA